MARLKMILVIWAFFSFAYVICDITGQTCNDGVDRPRLRRAMTQACDESNSEVIIPNTYTYNRLSGDRILQNFSYKVLDPQLNVV